MSINDDLRKMICKMYGVEEIPDYDFDPLSLLKKKYQKENNINNEKLWDGVDWIKQEAKKIKKSKKQNKNKK